MKDTQRVLGGVHHATDNGVVLGLTGCVVGRGTHFLVDHARLVVESWRSKSRDFKVGWEIVLAGNTVFFIFIFEGQKFDV